MGIERPSGLATRMRPRKGRDSWLTGAEVLDIRRKPSTWMAAAFCASLALAVGIVSVFGAEKGVYLALAATARLAFLIFWLAYAGGALASLFGGVFLPLREHARDLGLAFAAALSVHLGLVACLVLAGHPPGVRTFVIFGAAATFTYLLALFSVQRVRQALPRNLWPAVRAVAMNYILLAFLLDFVRFRSAHLTDIQYDIRYLPFAVLGLAGPVLKFAAWAQYRIQMPRRKEICRQSN